MTFPFASTCWDWLYASTTSESTKHDPTVARNLGSAKSSASAIQTRSPFASATPRDHCLIADPPFRSLRMTRSSGISRASSSSTARLSSVEASSSTITSKIGHDDRDSRLFDAQQITQIKYVLAEGKILVNVGLRSCAYALCQLWRIEETADRRGESYGIETGHRFTADLFNQL